MGAIWTEDQVALAVDSAQQVGKLGSLTVSTWSRFRLKKMEVANWIGIINNRARFGTDNPGFMVISQNLTLKSVFIVGHLP